MMWKLVAAAATTGLLVTAAPTANAVPAVNAPVSCTKAVLTLPADSEPGSSQATKADPSGRYILGSAGRKDHLQSNAVLWVNGVPRWLGTDPAGESFAYSVITGGLVLGTTATVDGVDYWIYSAKTNKYKLLTSPDGLEIASVAGMNKNQDIVGTTRDGSGAEVPFVWPAGGRPRLLPMPAGQQFYAFDAISDEGLIAMRFQASDSSPNTSYLYESWNKAPVRLPGLHQDEVWARDIEGRWIAGGETDGENVTGLLWNTTNTRIVELEQGVIDLNSSRDAVTAGAFGPFGDYPSMIIRSDGTKITFPDGTLLSYIFEHGTKWTAAGFDVSTGTLQPILYACNS